MRSFCDQDWLLMPLPRSRKSSLLRAKVSGCSRGLLLLPLPPPPCSPLREEGHLWGTSPPLRVWECPGPSSPACRLC